MNIPARLFAALLAFSRLPQPVPAAEPSTSLVAAVQSAQAEVEQAAAELAAARLEIAGARGRLSSSVQAARREVAALREQTRRQRMLAVEDAKARAARAETLERRRAEYQYLAGLLDDYQRGAATRLNEAEAAHIRVDAAPPLAGLAPGEWPAAVTSLFQRAVQRLDARWGGWRFSAAVLDASGIEVRGEVFSFGPVACFNSDDRLRAGWVSTRFGQGQPSLEEDAGGDTPATLRALAEGREALVPVDVTGGSARKVARARTTLAGEFRKGGLVMWPLAGVGVLALLLAVWKTADLARIRSRAGPAWEQALALLRSDGPEAALARARSLPSPLDSLADEAICCRAETRAQLEEILHEHLIGFLPRLERHLGTLAVLGGIAPLLGLLGTVTGMIHTFQLVTIFGSGDAKLLSGGISEALITTKYGLIIAVPVLLVHAALARRARAVLAALEQSAVGMVNDLKGRGGSA